MGGETHVDLATEAFGGAPYGATKRVRGVPRLTCGERGNACGLGHWGLRWSSLWGYETLYWACRKGHAVGGEPHMNPVTGAFGGAPDGATKRYTGRVERDMWGAGKRI